MRFRVEASVGNGQGVFDAAYDFGDGICEASVTGTPQAIGEAVAHYLERLTDQSCQEMRYGTDRFFVQFVVTPDEASECSEDQS